METVHTLLREVVRGFYDVKATLVVEALLVHHVLSDRELASLMQIPAKDLRSTCARLKDDHLLKEVSHKDDASAAAPPTSFNQQRAFFQTLYYIHFTEAVDAIKWKMHQIEMRLREEMDAQHNPQDYVCDTCSARYKTLDALSNFDPSTGSFLCEVCGSPLREYDGPSQETAQDKMEGLTTQLKPLIILLKRLDDMTIPENTFDSESAIAVPLPSPDDTGEMAVQPMQIGRPGLQDAASALSGITVAGSSGSRLPQAVQSTFQVHITSEEEQAAEAAGAAAERERLAEENALPDWHARSTVSAVSQAPKSIVKPELAEIKAETVEVQKTSQAEDDAMDAYYRKLQAEKAEGAKDEAPVEAKDEDEDEDEDDYEDVDV